jgi:hypothetical protein
MDPRKLEVNDIDRLLRRDLADPLRHGRAVMKALEQRPALRQAWDEPSELFRGSRAQGK